MPDIHGGSIFTWTNNKILKRFHTSIININWKDTLRATSVVHLPRKSSKHSPLLMIAKNSDTHIKGSFRFLDMHVALRAGHLHWHEANLELSHPIERGN